jgi:hypothetical protein
MHDGNTLGGRGGIKQGDNTPLPQEKPTVQLAKILTTIASPSGTCAASAAAAAVGCSAATLGSSTAAKKAKKAARGARAK